MPQRDDAITDERVDRDAETETYRASYGELPGVSPSTVVVETVGRATGSDDRELRPLFDVIDPDALNQLFTSGDESATGRGRVTFEYEGCHVVVHEDGRVAVSAGPSP